MGKVIDITGRLNSENHKENSDPKRAASVVSIVDARTQAKKQERRQVKRTILNEFVGAFAVLPERGLLRVTIFDISEKGIAFDLGIEEGNFETGDKVAMRIYLNHKTFFPFVAEITNVRFFIKEGTARHGTNFVKGTVNDVALYHFVKFIETVSTSLKTDDGDMQISTSS